MRSLQGGGFIGDFAVYLGGEEQTPHPWMAKEMRRESVQKELCGLTPGYAPYVSAVVPTAYIGKRATIPETWIELQNCPNALGLGQIGEDANPAEILYALITNTDWGVAENPDVVDRESLVKMGETLKKEGIGLSVQLTSKSKAQALIDKICEHINAVRFSHPATGKLTFRLIRDDYKVQECLRLSPVELQQSGHLPPRLVGNHLGSVRVVHRPRQSIRSRDNSGTRSRQHRDPSWRTDGKDIRLYLFHDTGQRQMGGRA